MAEIEYKKIIEMAEEHNAQFKYIKKYDMYKLVYTCPISGQRHVESCPTHPNEFSYFCADCGSWIRTINLYKRG